MLYIFISLLLGMIPDVLYYVLLITRIKNVKEKKIILFILLAAIYIVTYMIFRYNFYLYILHGILIYLSLKLLYKSKINDYFLVSFLYSYYFINSLSCYFLISNYAVALVINKIMLFVPLIFNKKLQKLYQNYNKMWNRNNKRKYPIKSITLRNTTLLVTNILIVSINITLIYIMSIV